MSNQAESVVLQYLDAVAKKELDRCAGLLDPEVRFVGPAMILTGVPQLLAAFRRLGAVHVRSDIKRVFSDGHEVCVIYDFVTDTLGALPAVEWVRVEQGRVKAVNLYYDQVLWLKVREELARRASA